MIATILHLFSSLPLGVLYFISNILRPFAFLTYRRRLVKKNIENSFPEMSVSQVREIMWKFYKNLVEVMMESLHMAHIKPDHLKKRVTYTNIEDLKKHVSENECIIIFATHQANWEWCSQAIALHGLLPSHFLYKSIAHPDFEKFYFNMRSRLGVTMIEKDTALRFFIKNKNQISTVGILPDQVPTRSSAKFWVKFLHQETAFFKGITYIPRILDAHCYFGKVKRTARGHYQVSFIPLGKLPETSEVEILKRYVLESEKMIHERPSDWLWSHNRWKYRKPDHDQLV